MNELKRDNSEIRGVIQGEIDAIVSQEVLLVHDTLKQDHELLMGYLEKPGRGIGGSLVLRMAGLLNSEKEQDIALRVAAATEVQNAALLIIDDWMDESDFRKKQSSIHKQYERIVPQTHRTPEQHKHTAESLAVQLGLVALYVSNILVTSRHFPEQGQIIHNMQTGLLHVTSGCMLETRLAIEPDLQTEENVLSVYANKTGYYSFETPMRSGLILAGADKVTIQSFAEIAQLLGLAFQLQDDLMGTFGNPEVTGKPNTDDLREGLHTLLYHIASQKMPTHDFQVLQAIHGKRDITDKEVVLYKQLLIENDIDVLIRQKALEYLEASTEKLNRSWQSNWNPEVYSYIESLINFLRQKDYSEARKSS